jgi:hypothetical protein
MMEKGVSLWNQEKASILVIFGTSVMILHNWTLQRLFSKLKKHPPTNLYMLYPMVQSFALVCVENIQENDTAKALSITIIRFTVAQPNNTPVCQQEALPARYRRTASISTYTHNLSLSDLISYAGES